MKDFGYRYLAATRFLRSTAMMYANIAMPLYLLALNVKIVYIGFVFLAALMFGITSMFLLGMLGDRIGYKYSLIVSEAFAIVGITTLAFSTNVSFIVAGMIIGGVSGTGGALKGFMSPGFSAYIANNWNKDRDRARRMAMLSMLGAIGGIFGSALLYLNEPLSGYFGQLGAFRAVFGLAGMLLLVSLLFMTMLKESKRPKKTTHIMRRESLRYSLRVIGATVVTGMGIGITMPLIPLWFKLSFGLGTTTLSYVFIGYYAVVAIGAYIASKLVRRLDLVNLGSWTRLVNGVLLIAMAFSPFAILAIVLYQLWGFSSAIGVSSRSAVNIKGIHREDYGTASMMQGIVMNLSQSTSGLSGYVLEYALPAPPLIGGILQAIGGLFYKKLLTQKR